MTLDLDDFYIIINRLDETHNFHAEYFFIRGHLEGVSGRFLKSAAEKRVRTPGRLPGLSGLYPDHPGVDPDHPASTFSFCCFGQFFGPRPDDLDPGPDDPAIQCCSAHFWL